MTTPKEKKILAVYEGLFSRTPSRAEKRIVQILEAAIKNYVKIGIENTTYESIAKVCGVTPPLVQHYFKDKSEIFPMCAKYIRVSFQQIAVESIQSGGTYTQQLEEYVGALFIWNKKFPLHAKAWNLVYYYASIQAAMKRMHTELALIGHERIAALLEAGARSGEFAADKILERAKLIQGLYYGGMIMVTSEDLPFTLQTFRTHLIKGCLSLARSADL